jgi:hypothetical protein
MGVAIAHDRVNGKKIEYRKDAAGTWNYTNPYKNKCYLYFKTYGDMSFEEFKHKSKLHDMRPSAFDEVRNDLINAGELITKEQRRLEKQSNEKNGKKEPINVPIHIKMADGQEDRVVTQLGIANHAESETVFETGKPAPGQAIASAFLNAKIRNKLDPALKTKAREIIKQSPSITFDKLQEEMRWPELTKPNFYNLRNELKDQGLIPVDADTRATEETTRIKIALKKITSLKQLQALDLEMYQRTNGHYLKVPQNFYYHKRKRMELLEAEAKATPAAVPENVAALTAKVAEVFNDIPLQLQFSPCHR